MLFRRAALVARSSYTVAARRSPLVQQQRLMGGGGHGKVEYTGIEASVRKIFPEDHQVVLANFGAFFGIYCLYKLATIGKKPAEAEPAPVVAAASASDSEVPSIFDESFEEWAKVPGNLEKYEKSVEDWANSQK